MYKNQSGMTLVEIMIVMVIIGLIASFAITNVIGQLDRAEVNTAKAHIGNIEQALQMYRLSCRRYPDNLNALVEDPGDCPSWGPDPFLKELPQDPWGNEYEYQRDGRSFVVNSLGPDEEPGGGDDISSDDQSN